MYCKNCGKFMNDDDPFCPNCGTPNTAQVAQTDNGQYAPQTDLGYDEPTPRKQFNLSKKAKIGIIAGAAAAVVLAVVLILVFSLGGSNSPEGVIKKMVKAEQTLNVQDMVDVCYPDEVLNYMLKRYDMTKSEFKRNLKKAQEEYDEMLEDSDYDAPKISYKITDNEKLDKDDLKNLNAWYNNRFDTSKKYISEARELTVLLKTDDDDWDDAEEETVTVIKVDGKWYLSLKDMGNPLSDIFSGSYR